MKQVGVYEAKTKLPKLLEEVEHGETVTITRHGKPIAKLVPVDPQRKPIREVIEAMRRERQGRSLGGLKIRDLINEGRKY
jgi:prevent-host-death family protein